MEVKIDFFPRKKDSPVVEEFMNDVSAIVLGKEPKGKSGMSVLNDYVARGAQVSTDLFKNKLTVQWKNDYAENLDDLYEDLRKMTSHGKNKKKKPAFSLIEFNVQQKDAENVRKFSYSRGAQVG